METIRYPKVLIFGETFQTYSGSGITITNLFNNWPAENLAVVTVSKSINKSDFKRCLNYYQLGSLEEYVLWPLKLFKNKSISGQITDVQDMEKSGDVQRVDEVRVNLRFVLYKMLIKCLHFIGIYNYVFKYIPSKPLIKFVENFNPDIIYFHPNSYQIIDFCLSISTFLNKTTVVHVMDDTIYTINRKGLLKRYWDKQLQIKFNNLLSLSPYHFCISDMMATVYQERFHRMFKSYHNPANEIFFKREMSMKMGHTFSILYAGRVGIGSRNIIYKIAKAINYLNNKRELKIKFIIKTPFVDDMVIKKALKFDCCELAPFTSYDKLPTFYQSADALIIPLDFDQTSINFIHLSMPTKITEYLASGTPLIVVTPPNTALYKFVENKQIAFTITSNKIDVLSNKIEMFYQDKKLRESISKRAYELATAEYKMSYVSDKFAMDLIKIIEFYHVYVSK